MMAQRLAGGGTGHHVLVSLEASLELVGMLAWSSPLPGDMLAHLLPWQLCSLVSSGPLPQPEFAGGGHPAACRLGLIR